MTRHREVTEKIGAVLFRHDPVGLAPGSNADAYDSHAHTIVSKLLTCGSIDHAVAVVHEEFCREFGEAKAGALSRYAAIGDEIWQIWSGRT